MPRAFIPMLLAVLLLPAGTGLAAEGPPACEAACVTAIPLPVPGSPFGITSGPLGSIWFSLSPTGGAAAIGRIDQHGTITAYTIPTANALVGWLAPDPSGAVWFAERQGGKIGRITPDGFVTEIGLPTSPAGPQGIVLGPDGNLYITEQFGNAIARVNPVTGAAVDFPVPTPNSTTQSGTLGPDGAIWFVERSAAKVGRMALDGTFTEYPLTPGAFPNRIVAAPDGNLWFTELNAGKLGRITPGGVLTEFAISGGPVGITLGKDGQLYVDLLAGHAVDRVNLDGAVTGQWALPGAVSNLQITTGFGLDIWVTDSSGDQLYRVTPYGLGH